MIFGKKFFVLVSAIVVLIAIFLFKFVQPAHSQVILSGKTFSVEVADTPMAQRNGLSGRDRLEDNQGMLFVFHKPDKYGFWMKDMKFPIDILWIDQNLKIVSIEKSLSPDTYPKIFYPSLPVMYTLEISANQSDKIGAKIGDKIKLN